jgi:ubiquitin carboxyl-terminal hydrolase 14
MKVMIASKLLKDTDDLSKFSIKPGQVVTVIGTAGPLPSAPRKPVVFLEDMPESQLAAIRPPLGLQNLGNTCYMNASLQAIRTIPELDPALREYRLSGPSGADKDAAFTQSLKTLFGTMREKTVSEDYVVPLLPLTSLRQVAPQFSEQDPHGGYSQQGMSGFLRRRCMVGLTVAYVLRVDADEMWTQTISSLHHALRPAGSPKSFVDQYLSADLQQT